MPLPDTQIQRLGSYKQKEEIRSIYIKVPISMHADEKMRMVTKLIFGEIKECWGKFLPLSGIPPADAAKLLALSLITGVNRGVGRGVSASCP